MTPADDVPDLSSARPVLGVPAAALPAAALPDESASPPPVLHGTFTVRADLGAPASAIFEAWRTPDLRHQWIRLPGRRLSTGEPDVVAVAGAHETLRSELPIGDALQSVERRTRFVHLVPAQRAIFAYEAIVDERLRWTAIATIELAARGAATRLTWTEQYVFVEFLADGRDDLSHLRGATRLQLNALGAVLGVVAEPVDEP